MSSLTRMGIQGIRSFSPDEEQTIRFHKPLTLICGPNGTGKSTIIECLKYATTGILPPSIKNGQAFIFDPDLANTSEVKAAIRLLFKNRTNRLTFVSRNFQLTQKKSKKEFKALDGTLKLKDAKTNLEVVHSHRCSDLDKLVPELLGVSAAIIDNVLFCHQEEANWPLRESAELKKKFDDIFESTRYTKALGELRKQKKEAADRAKDANRDVAVLATHLDRSNQLKLELDLVKEKLEESTGKVLEFNRDIDANQLRVTELSQKVQQFQGSFEEMKSLTGVISERERMVERERRELGVTADLEALDESKLAELTAQANQQVTASRAQIAQCEQKLAALERQRNALLAEVEKLNHERASMQGRMEEFTRQSKRHEVMVQEFRTKYPKHFSNTPSASSGLMLLEMKTVMSSVVKDKRDELERLEQSSTEQFEQSSKQLNDLRAKLANLTHEKQAKQDLYDKLASRLDSARQQLLRLGEDSGASDGMLREAKLKHKKSERHLQELLAGADAAERNLRIDALNKESQALDLQRKGMDGGIALLESQQTAQTRLDNKTEEIAKKLGAISANLQATKASTSEQQALVDGIVRELQGCLHPPHAASPSKKPRLSVDAEGASIPLLPSGVAKNTSLQLKQLCDLVSKQVEEKRAEQHELRVGKDRVIAQSTICDGKLSQISDECAHLQLSKRAIEESLPKQGYYSVLGEFEHEFSAGEAHGQTALRLLREQLSQATEAKLNMAHLKSFYKQMMKKLERAPDTCPTCEQNCSTVACSTKDQALDIELDSRTKLHFDASKAYTGGKALQLMMWYKTESTAFESKLQQFEQEILALEQKIAAFAQFQLEADKLSALELDLRRRQDAKAKLDLERESLARESARLVKLFADLEFPIKNLERQEDAVKELVRTGRDAERMELELEKEVALLAMETKRLGPEFRGLTLFAARQRAREMDDKKNAKYAEMQREMQEQRQSQLQCESASEDVKASAQLVAELERDNAQRLQLVTERARLTEEQNQAFAQSEALTGQISPLEFESSELDRQRQAAQLAQRKQMELVRRELELVQFDEQNLNACKEQIELALRSGTKDALLRLDAVLLEERDKLAKIKSDVAGRETELVEAQDEYRSAGQGLLRYQNCAKLAKAKAELRDIVQKKRQMEQEAFQGQQTSVELAAELKQLQDALAQKRLRKEKLLGGREANEQQLRQLQTQLGEPNLRDIAKRHSEKMCDAILTNLACKDLEKYTKALDNALMLFHSEKIEDINKRVRELWQVIYKGGDIDRVELKAERGTGVSAHTYTYRVVFRKNHTEMDMKGRCSAGQKVLASLVIRLALAETFSPNCGVLALDEPSANLDVDNKRGLAEALAEIILSRRNQENFQLIVITHDDEFVEVLQAHLGTNGGPYWRLSREQDATGKYVSIINEEKGLV